jgi:LPXTG-motif cell wall-anchored protein
MGRYFVVNQILNIGEVVFMAKRLAIAAVLLLGAVGAAHARPISAPGPDIESSLFGVSLAAGIAWVLKRRRNKA